MAKINEGYLVFMADSTIGIKVMQVDVEQAKPLFEAYEAGITACQ